MKNIGVFKTMSSIKFESPFTRARRNVEPGARDERDRERILDDDACEVRSNSIFILVCLYCFLREFLFSPLFCRFADLKGASPPSRCCSYAGIEKERDTHAEGGRGTA